MNGLRDGEVLHCIGESHCLRFSDLCWVDDRRAITTRVHFLPDVEAANFTGDGGLHPDVAAALLATGLCTETAAMDGASEIVAAHRGTTFTDRVLAARHAALADRPLVAPTILWFAGDKDVHSLAVALGPEVDFEVPGHDEAIAVGASRVLHADVEAALQHRLQPFFEGLQALATAGFTRSLVHALSPRCSDVDRVARWLGGAAIPTALRTKLARLANRLIRRRCDEIGVGFVDPWAELAVAGTLDPRFDLDGVHLNRAATERAFPRLVTAVDALGEGAPNDRQYELLAELAVTRTPSADAVAQQIAARGHAVVPGAGRDAAPPGRDPRTLPNLDGLATGWAYEVGVVLTSRVAFAPAPRVVADALRGVRGAVVAATAGATITVRFANGGATAVQLAPGDVLLFDPARVDVSSDAAADGALLHLLVLARLPAEEPVVVERGGAWPADPFRVCGQSVDDAGVPTTVRRWREVGGKTIVLPRPAAAPVAAATH